MPQNHMVYNFGAFSILRERHVTRGDSMILTFHVSPTIYNSNERSQPARQQPMTQTIQIPASMAGHQLVALQMPDGRQQIFALQGNQTLQMIQTPAGLQQVII